MKKGITIIGYIMYFFFISSCAGLYGTKTKWEKVDKYKGDIITVKSKDLFQLRITESLKMIESKEKKENETEIISDIPYRSFEQSLENSISQKKKIVEETYLYLDKYGSDTALTSGIALYLITYPIINEKVRKNIYNEDQELLYLNIIRDILVGFWEKTDSTYTIAFKKREKNLFVMKGNSDSTREKIGITRVSHTVTRELRKDIKKKDSISLNECDYKLAYINLNGVLDLGKDTDELLFLNVPNHKKLVIAPKLGKKELRKGETIDVDYVKSFSIEDDTVKDRRIITWKKKKIRNFYIKACDIVNYKKECDRAINYYKFKKKKVHMLFHKD